MTQGIPCGFKIQWQSIHQEPQSISRCFHWGWVSSIDWISLPELSKAFIYDDIVYDGLFICYAKKNSLESNCHIDQTGIWSFEQATLPPLIHQNCMGKENYQHWPWNHQISFLPYPHPKIITSS